MSEIDPSSVQHQIMNFRRAPLSEGTPIGQKRCLFLLWRRAADCSLDAPAAVDRGRDVFLAREFASICIVHWVRGGSR
jgi:hypothetical protein